MKKLNHVLSSLIIRRVNGCNIDNYDNHVFDFLDARLSIPTDLQYCGHCFGQFRVRDMHNHWMTCPVLNKQLLLDLGPLPIVSWRPSATLHC